MRFSVLSYNVLHEQGAKRLLRARGGGGIPAWAKDRLPAAARLAQQLSPDVACFQEVDPAAQAALERTLGEDFALASLMRNEALPPKDGCAIFVRRARFDVVRTHQFRLRDTVPQHFPAVEEVRKRASGMTGALWRELHEKLNMSVAVELQAKEPSTSSSGSAPTVCVASTHLYWDPQYPDLKLLQAFLAARELAAFAGQRPLVLAGDLNSTPLAAGGGASSGVFELLTKGSVSTGHPDHPVALRPPRGILAGVQPADVPELAVEPMRSAYHEAGGSDGIITNVSQDFRGCLDYVLFRQGLADGREAVAPALRLVGARATPTMEELKGHLPLPSPEFPSDHMPVLAHFELTQ